MMEKKPRGDGSGFYLPRARFDVFGFLGWRAGRWAPRAAGPVGFFSILFILLFSSGVFAQQGPFPHRIQHPVYLQTVNLDPERAVPLKPGDFEVRADSAYSNLYERTNPAPFDVTLDMELWRIAYEFAYGFTEHWEVGLEVATLHWEGGFLDPFIQKFHNTFGFPNGGREEADNNAFGYEVRRNGSVLLQTTPQVLDAGDMTFLMKNLVWEEGKGSPALAWRFAFKIPSGDPSLGLGSGQPGIGLGLVFEKNVGRFGTTLNTNYLVDGGQGRLDGLMHSIFFDFSLAEEFRLHRRVSAIAQLVGGTPRLRGLDFHVWDGVPLDLILGLKGDAPLRKSAKLFLWQLGFAEDVTAHGPSVDFTAWISLGMRFGKN